MMEHSEQRVADMIADAPDFSAIETPTIREGHGEKPKLLIENTDPQRTLAAMRDILADHSPLFDRGSPVRLVSDRQTGTVTARPLTADSLVMMVHDLSRPYVTKTKDGMTHEQHQRFPRSLAVAYLDWHGEWNLRALNGIAATPLSRADGSIFSANGYDETTGIWLENVLDVTALVPDHPTEAEALRSLALVRKTFATFCFADADLVQEPGTSPTVELRQPVGYDETAFLVALLTAVCRPSLDLAPGFLIRAPQLSGAGAGKGLLARSICRIAFGREPHAVTGGTDLPELEKRIVAELIGGGPVMFLDNLNNLTFKSNLLASALTERPARVRILGKSEMLPLNATTLVILTGNALSVSEDLSRRFIVIELDPRLEDPETRSFPVDFRQSVTERRADLLAALFTIWRWGRLQPDLPRGLPLGSFEQWGRWVRDPLLALGCRDPVERLVDAKKKDGQRQEIVEIFQLWQRFHQERPVTAHGLHQQLKQLIDPQKRGRQFVASQVAKLAGARVGGFTLSRQTSGKWSADTYSLTYCDSPGSHRDHRDHEEICEHRRESDD